MTRLGHHTTLFGREGDGGVTDDELFDRYGVLDRFGLARIAAGSAPVLGTLAYAWRSRRMSKRLGLPDVYWGRQLQSLLAVASLGIPIIYEVHALAPSRYHRLLERRILAGSRVVRVVVISGALREDFLRAHPGVDPGLVIVAHDGADPVTSDPAPVEPWPGRHESPQLGYTGHLYEGRGVEIIVELARRLPGADFHLVGGTDADLHRWREYLSVDPRLTNIWLHGHQPASSVPGYIARFDIVLAPYQHRIETSRGSDISRWISPMKLFEYMAMGKPIVASDLPTIAEVLVSGRHAVLCPSADIDAWETAVRSLLDDPPLRRRLGVAARAELERAYTWEHRVATVLTLPPSTAFRDPR